MALVLNAPLLITSPGAAPTSLTFVCISDTHNRLRDYISRGLVPAGDVLLHCGDFTNHGTPAEVIEFNECLALLPHKYRVCFFLL